jgi:hypothetical protein
LQRVRKKGRGADFGMIPTVFGMLDIILIV